MAFVRNISSNTDDSQQSSPAYVLTFTRWRNRDTTNYTPEKSTTTRKPLVVVNDAVNLSVQNSKKTPTPTFSCMLRQGDLNYLTAIAPGDYVCVNMVNWETKAMEIRARAIREEPINRADDGFKGLFKILDVRMVLSTAPGNGAKQYYVQVTARGFDEFNNVIYFNPAVADSGNQFLFLNNFKNFIDLVKNKTKNNVQELTKEIIKRTIGVGLSVIPKDTMLDQIPAYRIPDQVGSLLNKKGKKFAFEINHYYLGIWPPSREVNIKSAFSTFTGSSNLSGFSSFFKPDEGGNFFNTGKSELPGTRQLSVQDFQNIKVWSLLEDYSNPVLNESYTCYRVGVDGKHVYPSLVVRQKPFNTNHYERFVANTGGGGFEVANHTKFLDLPRWKVDPELITNLNLGRSDSGRINFVQIFTRSLSVDKNFDQAAQIKMGNFVEDTDDVKRSGRKPFVRSCNYDFAGTDVEHRAKKWSRLVADWVFNGHLKMNGKLTCIGIEEPICIGDNLELDSIVYHIEDISHNMSINENGVKSFRTTLNLSMGVSKKSSSTVPVYAEMDYTDAKTRREDDFENEKILPGFSDTQDLPSREKGEEASQRSETKEATFTNPRNIDKGDKF